MWRDELGVETFCSTLQKLPELRVLVMSHARLMPMQKNGVIEAIPSLRKLRYLSVRHWKMNQATADALMSACAALPALKHIAAEYALCRFVVGTAPPRVEMPFGSVQSLRDLDISDLDIWPQSPFTESYASELRKSLRHFVGLTSLRLLRPNMEITLQMTSERSLVLQYFGHSALSVLTNLRCLSINLTGMGMQLDREHDGGLGECVSQLTSLSELDISSCWPSVDAFVPSPFPPSLCKLRLGLLACDRPESAGHMCAALSALPRLTELSLRTSPVKVLHECLSGCGGLRRLDISAHCFGPELMPYERVNQSGELTAGCLGLQCLPQLTDIAVRDDVSAAALQESIRNSAPESLHVRIHAMNCTPSSPAGIVRLAPLPWLQDTDSPASLFERYAT
jgi:hypothetical protein